MRVFVTGSNGQLARCLAEARSSGIELVFGARPHFDLARPDDARQQIVAASPDLVINAAAYTAVDKAEAEEALAFAINCDGARAVAQAAADLDVPIIHISTDYVFPGDKSGPYVENDQTGPIGAYGRTKLAGENAVRLVARKHLIFRTAWVYSVYGANFVKTMLRLGRDRPELRVVGDQHGNPTSAHDLATAVLKAGAQLRRGDAEWGTYHLAGTGDATWHEFAEHIFDVAADSGQRVPHVTSITTSEYPTPAKRPQNSRMDCSLVKETFDLALPHWRDSTRVCVQKLLVDQAAT